MTANRPADAPHKTPDIWGASSAGFYAEMEGERLVIDLVNAEQVHGMLLGVDRNCKNFLRAYRKGELETVATS